jgi:hypothetical protein
MSADRVIENPLSGERITIRRTAAQTVDTGPGTSG